MIGEPFSIEGAEIDEQSSIGKTSFGWITLPYFRAIGENVKGGERGNLAQLHSITWTRHH